MASCSGITGKIMAAIASKLRPVAKSKTCSTNARPVLSEAISKSAKKGNQSTTSKQPIVAIALTSSYRPRAILKWRNDVESVRHFSVAASASLDDQKSRTSSLNNHLPIVLSEQIPTHVRHNVEAYVQLKLALFSQAAACQGGRFDEPSSCDATSTDTTTSFSKGLPSCHDQTMATLNVGLSSESSPLATRIGSPASAGAGLMAPTSAYDVP